MFLPSSALHSWNHIQECGAEGGVSGRREPDIELEACRSYLFSLAQDLVLLFLQASLLTFASEFLIVPASRKTPSRPSLLSQEAYVYHFLFRFFVASSAPSFVTTASHG